MNKREVIENFIHQFNAFGDDVRKCFSYGMCYHFALILHIRFRDEDAHKLYDLTGDITDETIYTGVPWKNLYYEDPKLADRIRRDCIWKGPGDEVLCEFCSHSFDDDWGNKICDIDNHPVTGNDSCPKGEMKR